MHSNFALIRLNKKQYPLYRMDYVDEKHLSQLRKDYGKTNSFMRSGNYVYHSPMVSNDFFDEGDITNISVRDEPNLTKSLIQHMLFRHLFTDGITFTKFQTIEFFNTRHEARIENDFVFNLLNKEERKKFGYWLGYQIDSRLLDNGLEKEFLAIFNLFYEWKIKVSCKDLSQRGIDLRNKYVVARERNDIFIFNKLLGSVISHDDETATVEKLGEVKIYSLSDLYLENSYENRQLIFETILGANKASKIINHLYNSSHERKGAEPLSGMTKVFHNRFKNIDFTNNHGFSFSIGELMQDKAAKWPSSIEMSKPTYVFNIQGNHIDTWHDRGLSKFGPYSKESLGNSTPTIIIICRSETKGSVTQFVGKFFNGITIVSKKFQPFEQGFKNKYRFENINYRVYVVENETIEAYDKAIRQALEEVERIDIAIVESCERYKELDSVENPYYHVKAKLLQNGITSQEILYETMLLRDNRLAYILNNISLAAYAKLGGKPWLTPSVPNIDHEIVIGIGNKIFKKDRFTQEKRVVGITTLFSKDGNFELSNTSKDVAFDEYLEELLRSLKVDIDRIKAKDNWQKGDTLRLVFHVFKPFKDEEIDIIERVIGDLQSDFRVEYAYLTISMDHPFRLFDENEKGVTDWNNQSRLKGVWQPARGVNFKLDNNNMLLQLIGPGELKTSFQGMAKPILIKLHEKSTFNDISYLTKQVYKFANISWKSFLPTSLPVTIDYSNQIADLLGNLRELPYWDPNYLFNLKHKVWFL